MEAAFLQNGFTSSFLGEANLFRKKCLAKQPHILDQMNKMTIPPFIYFFLFFCHGIFFLRTSSSPWGRPHAVAARAAGCEIRRWPCARSALAPRYGDVHAPAVPSPRLCPSGDGINGGAALTSHSGHERALEGCVPRRPRPCRLHAPASWRSRLAPSRQPRLAPRRRQLPSPSSPAL